MYQCTDPESGEQQNIPVTWPPSEDFNWVNKQIELYARNVQTPDDLHSWYSKSKVELKKLLDQQAVPASFVQFKWDPSIENRFSDKWGWTKFRDCGYFMGNRLPDDVAAREPFSNWNELIALIGNTIAASYGIIRRSSL